MDTYEINLDTLIIMYKNESTSVVYEKNNMYIINQNINSIIDNSCKYFGSTYKGRRDGSINLLNISYKVPIIIEDSTQMIFFPTTSLKDKKCSWISLNNILKYERNIRGSKIYFKDGNSIIISTSYGVLNNQILRSTRLQYLINKRKEEKSIKN